MFRTADHDFFVASMFSKCHIRQWNRRRGGIARIRIHDFVHMEYRPCMAHWHVIVPRRQDDMACFGLAHPELAHELHDGLNTAAEKLSPHLS